MKRHALPVLGFAIGLALLGACNAKSSSSSGSLAIQLVNAPATLNAGQTASLTATVSNDSSNGGVDWSCAPAGACGSFFPQHTTTGQPTVFTAPSAPGTVTVTAEAAASKTVSASATITIISSASNARLNGPYVFLVQGSDSNGPYAAAGRFIADGKGGITAGTQDYADAGVQAGPDAFTGSYSVSEDGRGSITLDVPNSSLPSNGVETFSFALASSTHALIIQFDGTAASSGTLDAQSAGASSAAAIDGPYAFMMRGYDLANQVPMGLGGVGKVSATAGTLTDGSILGNDGGTFISSSFAATLTGPDASGRGTIAMDFGLNFIYYAVKGGVLRMLQADAPTYVTAGSAYGQGTAGTNASFSNASLKGDYAFYEIGSSSLGDLGLAGRFTADGAGNLSEGFADTNDAGSVSAGSIAGQNVYTVTPNGAGELLLPGTTETTQEVSDLAFFVVDPAINILDPGSPTGGGGALVIDVDTGAVGAGLMLPRSPGDFLGDYASNFEIFGSSAQMDVVGLSTVSGSASLTGIVDVNDTGTTTSAAPLTGTFAADAANPGRWTGGLTMHGITFKNVLYQVSGSVLLMLDVDTAYVGSGFLEKD